MKARLEDEQSRLSGIRAGFTGVQKAKDRFIELEQAGDDSATDLLDARRRLHQLLKGVIEKVAFHPFGNEDSHHGVIRIFYQGVGSDRYSRVIFVDRSQKTSEGYRLRPDGEMLNNVTVNNTRRIGKSIFF